MIYDSFFQMNSNSQTNSNSNLKNDCSNTISCIKHLMKPKLFFDRKIPNQIFRIYQNNSKELFFSESSSGSENNSKIKLELMNNLYYLYNFFLSSIMKDCVENYKLNLIESTKCQNEVLLNKNLSMSDSNIRKKINSNKSKCDKFKMISLENYTFSKSKIFEKCKQSLCSKFCHKNMYKVASDYFLIKKFTVDEHSSLNQSLSNISDYSKVYPVFLNRNQHNSMENLGEKQRISKYETENTCITKKNSRKHGKLHFQESSLKTKSSGDINKSNKSIKNNNSGESSENDATNDNDENKSKNSLNTSSNQMKLENNTDMKQSNITSVYFVDACSLWKFPPWLVERLDLEHTIPNISTLSVDKYRRILMRQIKSTATDLLLYQTVRREFLRTILVIELNNIVKLMEYIVKLGLDDNLKNEIFKRLKSIVSALDNPEKNYIPEMQEMAYQLDELYVLISPDHILKGSFSYDFNIVYCSYLISRWAVVFNEKCNGGIVDNTWFSNESRYMCMVMITPQVYGDSSKIPNSFRVEAYFDVDKGRFGGFETSFKNSIDPKYVSTKTLECLIYSYLSKNVHWVEDKNIFLLNGPEVKGNTDFTKIYYSLNRKATL